MLSTQPNGVWARGYKTFYMLNSVEHEILNAHKYKKYQEIQLFSGSDKPRMLFYPLINVKMPTIVGILTFMSRKISCSLELSMKKVLLPQGQVLKKKENVLSEGQLLNERICSPRNRFFILSVDPILEAFYLSMSRQKAKVVSHVKLAKTHGNYHQILLLQISEIMTSGIPIFFAQNNAISVELGTMQ